MNSNTRIPLTLVITDANDTIYVYAGKLTKWDAVALAKGEDPIPDSAMFSVSEIILDPSNARNAADQIRAQATGLRDLTLGKLPP